MLRTPGSREDQQLMIVFVNILKKPKTNKQTNWGQRFISECEFFLACRCVSKAQSKVTLTCCTTLLWKVALQKRISTHVRLELIYFPHNA